MQLVLLTGFLGSGKTTFLKKLLADFKDTKIGVLMNEFGDIGIDGKLINTETMSMIELNGGSVFCACLKENFIQGLAQFLDSDFEIVFVEASGMADPSNIGTILETVQKLKGKTYTYTGAVCIVDGEFFLKQYDVIPAIDRQLRLSSVVLLNKSDTQTEDILQKIEMKIHGINSKVDMIRTVHCQIDTRALIEGLNTSLDFSEESTNSWESRPKACTLRTDVLLDLNTFKTFLEAIKADTYRIKGFVKTPTGNFEVSGVAEDIQLTAWDELIEKTEIVIIASVGIKIISTVLDAWKLCFGDTPKEFK